MRGSQPPCAGLTELMFSDHMGDRRLAMSLCRSCEYRELCLAGAVGRGETAGVWGGRWFGDAVAEGDRRDAARVARRERAALRRPRITVAGGVGRRGVA